MSYFSDDEKMYVPLSIDTVEARRSNYFFSNKKMLYAFIAFIPIFALLTPLIQAQAGLLPIMIVVVVYMVIYIYFLRFIVFEERRLKRMLRELDDNRVSEVDHFWGIDKVEDRGENDGMIYYSYKGAARGITSGLVVMLERGSTVGVPVGHYREYRKTMERFFRALHLNNLYGTVVELEREPELQESLKEYTELLKGLDNEYHQRLLRLNLSINSIYTMDKEQRYIEYVVIKQDGFNHNFRRLVETILTDVFSTNGYIQEARILNRRELEGFLKNYLQIETLDSSNIRKSVDVEPFENFALVHRLLDDKGREVPIHLMDELDIDKYRGKSIDQEIERLEKRERGKKKKEKEKLDIEIKKLNRLRNRERITQEEYLKRKRELEEMYTEESKKDRVEVERVVGEDLEQGGYNVKEYDLNEQEIGTTYVTGKEKVEDLVKKERGGILSRYINQDKKGEDS